MHRATAPLLGLICLALAGCAGANLSALGGERLRVSNLAGEPFLNLRAGPGLGFAVVVGLPEGAELRGGPCQLVGGTSWCEVTMAAAPGVTGYVARDYIVRY